MRAVNASVVPLLLKPAARTAPWRAFLAAAGLGLAIVAVPAATTTVLAGEDLVSLLRAAAVCGALGVAFLLDDPAARSIATVPTPRPIRYAARAGVILPVAAMWWALVLTVTVAGAEDGIGAALPLGGVTVEAAALSATALAVAAARMRGGREGGGIVAFPALLILVIAATQLPPSLALFVPPDHPSWPATHTRWTLLLAAALAAATWASLDPGRTRHR